MKWETERKKVWKRFEELKDAITELSERIARLEAGAEEYKFVDDVAREDVEKTVNQMDMEGWEFVAFLHNDNQYDQKNGILFKRKVGGLK